MELSQNDLMQQAATISQESNQATNKKQGRKIPFHVEVESQERSRSARVMMVYFGAPKRPAPESPL